MSDIIPYATLEMASYVADEVARQNLLNDYLSRKSDETKRQQQWSLKAFADYLHEAGVNAEGIALDIPHWQETTINLAAWKNVTFGIVTGFVHWQLNKGFAINSINVRLSTIKTYCKLAAQSGHLPYEELAKIMLVKGYRHKEGKNVDKNREVSRVGKKKATSIILSKEQVKQLKNQLNTPQGWRDRVIICFFLDHGLRCGELASLTLADIDFATGRFHVYREKVDKEQLHKLSADTLMALLNYLPLAHLAPSEQLLRGSQKSKDGNKLTGGMSKRAITARVNTLGKKIGIEELSAHDGRHTWGTAASRGKTDLKSLTVAGGWSSVTTPYNRYVEPNEVANEEVKLDY